MFRHIHASGGNAFCAAWLMLCVSVSAGCHRRPLEDPEYLTKEADPKGQLLCL